MGLYSEPTTGVEATHTAVAEPPEPAAEPAPERGRWRRWLYTLIAILVVIRVVPMILAPLVAARLSRVLGARVEIGQASLQPIDAVVALQDVVVYEPSAGTSAEAEPRLVAGRVLVDLQWLPLIHRMLRVREIVFESGRIDIDRMTDGSFHLASFADSDPKRELPEGWTFGLDRIVLLDTQLRLRDLAATRATRFAVTLRDAEVSGIGRRPTAFGRALNLRVDALVGKGGRLRVNGRYEFRRDGLVLDALVRVKDVPLAQVMSVVSEQSWADYSGRVSGQLRWQREPRRRDALSGRLILRRGTAEVADLDEPEFAVRRVVAEIDEVDFLRRRIDIGSLAFHGATLMVRPDAGAPIPLLEGTWPRRSRPVLAGARSRSSSVRDTPPGWTWMIERFDTAHGQLRVLAPDGSLDLRMHASGENLGPGAYWSPLRVEVAHGETGAAFDGTVLMSQRLLIEGRLTASGIDVPAFARAAGLPWAELIRTGRGAADLNVQLETDRELKDAADLRGKIFLADLQLAGSDATTFSVGAAQAELALERVVPGETTARGATPTRVEIGDATLTAPYARLVRTAECGVLPRIVIPAPALTDQALAAQPIAAVADGRPVVAPAPTPVPALGTTLAGPSSVPAPTPTPHIECGFATPLATPTPVDTSSTAEIVVREIRATDGRLRVADGVPDPPVTWDVAKVSGSARDLRLPALTYTGLDVRGGDFRFGGLHLSGARSARGSDLEFSGTDLALSATTPYLELVGLPYRFSGGWGSFRARLSIGEKGWTADTLLRLRDPRFADAASALDDAAGMPVARAVELLRDPEGDVVLRLPLSSASLASGGRIAQAISSGVRSSIRSAVEYSYIPVEVTFVPGRPQLTESSAQQLVSVGQLLESRSSLMAEIQAGTTRGDQRWLAEQSLSEGLREGGGGFMGVLRSLGVRDERQRIREALIARANGGPGPLDAEDEAVLERLLAEAPPVGPERLAALADARLATVRDHLVNRHYIERGRVITDRSQLEGAVVPIVRIEFRVGKPADIEPSVASPQEPVGARAAESDAWLGR